MHRSRARAQGVSVRGVYRPVPLSWGNDFKEEDGAAVFCEVAEAKVKARQSVSLLRQTEVWCVTI